MGFDGALGEVGHPVHVRRAPHVQAVPVDGRGIRHEHVLHVNHHFVAFAGLPRNATLCVHTGKSY